MKRGQSALEYLVTYGWAILAIVIIAAVLWYFGVFSQPKIAHCVVAVSNFNKTPEFVFDAYQIGVRNFCVNLEEKCAAAGCHLLEDGDPRKPKEYEGRPVCSCITP